MWGEGAVAKLPRREYRAVVRQGEHATAAAAAAAAVLWNVGNHLLGRSSRRVGLVNLEELLRHVKVVVHWCTNGVVRVRDLQRAYAKKQHALSMAG